MVGPIGIEPIVNPESTWNININSEEIQNLRRRYGNEIIEEDFQRVVETTARLMSHFPSPQGSNRVISGLALGKVQSGKTLSFTALIALASSNSYKIIVVLAGTKKNLLKQTKDRLEKDLGINESGIAHNIVMIANPKARDISSIRGALDTGRCALLVCMKNQSRMRPVTRLLSSPELRNRSPVLIIDDEGDEASLNTDFRNGQISTTYANILQLRSSVPKCVYLAYTATPQAPLLLQQLDALHPEFCVLVEPGSGYCGGSVFFGENRNNFLRIIQDEEEILESGGVPESLQDALALFFVGAAIRHIRNPNDKHSMLIHTSHLQDSHIRLEESITQLHERWRNRIRFRETDPGRQDLTNGFRRAYDDLIRTVNNPPDWDSISQRLDFELHATRIWVFNSTQLRGEEEPQFQLENNIVIGGNMLGRGVTIKNLSVTYITRRAEGVTNADTLEQRARWFGYKRSYLDLCRVYMTQQLLDDYIALLRSEDNFWDSLRRYSDHGLPVSEWRPLLLLYNQNDSLRPTRTNVASYARLRSNAWTIMQPNLNPETAGSNIEIINSFFQRNIPEDYPMGGHHVVRGFPVLQIIDELINRIIPGEQGEEWNTGFIAEYLSRLLSSGRLLNIDILLMHGVESGFRRRTPLGNGSINPMEGHNANYPGDREIHNGMPQLQVHKILYDGRIQACLLALHIPETEEYNMGQYYVRVDIE